MVNKKDVVLLLAEEVEYNCAKKYLPGYQYLLVGVGASNVIKNCCKLSSDTVAVSVGYAGSNVLDVGTVVKVSASHRLMTGQYVFVDYNNPKNFGVEGCPCYTSNSFITECDKTEPMLFDMELNYEAAFPFNLIGSVKIVSDRLSIEAFRNNAIRESGILSNEETWSKVAIALEELLAK